jgi:NTP pyrophosphatase (non-canonical NTP hydrolase)
MSGVMYAALGLNGEAGEVAEKIKKWFRGDCPLVETREQVMKELGDVLWYVSAVAKHLSLDLGDVAAENLAKLASRRERGVLRGSGDDR